MTRSRSERIFTAKKVRAYAYLSLGLTLLAYVGRIVLNHDVDGGLSRDFLCFWSVSKLSLQGQAASAFDPAVLAALQRSVGAGDTFYTWSYPPTFQLMILPLAFLSPLVSQVLWGAAGMCALAMALKRVLPQRDVVLVVSSSSLFLANLYLGQTGIWIATLYMIGIASLSSSTRSIPWGAAAFGLAVIKPHMGIMIPVMLLLKRQWAAFWIATAAGTLLLLCSLFVFGTDLWQQFFGAAGMTMELLGKSGYKAHLLTSVFSALQSFGLPNGAAYALHGLFTLAIAVITIRTMMKCSNPSLAAALATTAGLLFFPYIYFYDLMLLVPAMVVLVKHAFETSWLPREREMLAVLWFGPLLLLPIMEKLDLSLGVIFPCLAFALLARRMAPHPDLDESRHSEIRSRSTLGHPADLKPEAGHFEIRARSGQVRPMGGGPARTPGPGADPPRLRARDARGGERPLVRGIRWLRTALSGSGRIGTA